MLSLSKLHNAFYSYRRAFFGSVSHLFDFLPAKIYILSSISVNTVSWILTFMFKQSLSQDLIIMHFNVDFGVDLIGRSRQIFIIPSLGLAFIVLNIIICLVLLKSAHFKFLMHFILASAFLANIFLLIALGPIYNINFR